MIEYKVWKVIDSFDFDKLVERVYGKPYCFQQQDGCKSREVIDLTIPSPYTEDEDMHKNIPVEVNGKKMGVRFEVWLNTPPDAFTSLGDESSQRLFWERNFYPDFQTLVNDLFERGELEAGEYKIEIDW